ncbi:metallophosphoesterase family protein, partial [bacterium]
DYGEMRVVGIDNYEWPVKFRSASNLALASETESINHGNMGPEQFQWLGETLAGAGDKSTIAFTHLPLDQMLGDTTSPGGTKIPGVPKAEIIELLKDNNVSHVFIGHWHRNETKDLGGVIQVMTNTSGSVLYNKDQLWGFNIVHVKDWKIDSMEYVTVPFD